MVLLDNPSFVRSIYGVCFAVLLHIISSVLWVVSLSSAYWSRGSYSFLQSIDAVHTVGVWKTCITYIKLDPYSKTWYREDGDCWATSRYLFDTRIEISSILSFISCMFVAVVLGLYGLLYTAKSWRPFLKQAAIPGCKLIQMLVSLAMILVFSDGTDVAHNVRLWARHLGMATVVLMAFEVIFSICVGCSYKTWRRAVRDLCVDVSVYISDCARDFPGPAHQPQPRTTVIGNPNSPARPTTTESAICGPHEDHLEQAARWEHLDLQLEMVQEHSTAQFSPSGRRCGMIQYPAPLQHIFGRPAPKRRLQLEPCSTGIPSPVFTGNPEHVIYTEPSRSSNPDNGNPDNCSSRVTAEQLLQHIQHDSEVSLQSVSSLGTMNNRKLPKIPVPQTTQYPSPEPKQISDEVTVEEGRRRPKEKHIIQIESV